MNFEDKSAVVIATIFKVSLLPLFLIYKSLPFEAIGDFIRRKFVN